MSKPRRLCIFCEGYPISHEHIWADWMRVYLPKWDVKNHRAEFTMRRPTGAVTNTILRSGEPQSGRLAVVCEACNTGWMSILQQEAKPILIPLIEGKPILLARKQKCVLAAWIAMFTMVSEFLDKTGERIAITLRERSYLRETGKVPPNWKVWIAHQNQKTWRGPLLFHETMHVSKGDEPASDVPNTHSTTAFFGELYMHAISSQTLDISRQKMHGVYETIVSQLWPVRPNVISWPPNRPLTNDEAEHIAKGLGREARRVAVPRAF